MLLILFAISIVALVVQLVCWIWNVVIAFQNEDGVTGFLCICGLIGFFIGWANVNSWNHHKVMYAWTACVVVNIILRLVENAIL